MASTTVFKPGEKQVKVLSHYVSSSGRTRVTVYNLVIHPSTGRWDRLDTVVQVSRDAHVRSSTRLDLYTPISELEHLSQMGYIFKQVMMVNGKPIRVKYWIVEDGREVVLPHVRQGDHDIVDYKGVKIKVKVVGEKGVSVY